MKRAELAWLFAGVMISCVLVIQFAPSVEAFRLIGDIDPNGSGPFYKWDLQRFTDGKIPYWIHKKGSDDLSLVEVKSGLEESFNAWKAVDGVTLDFRFAGF